MKEWMNCKNKWKHDMDEKMIWLIKTSKWYGYIDDMDE